MLVLTRKVNESVLIWHDDDKEPLVLTIGGSQTRRGINYNEVKLNFAGSKRYKILRQEVNDVFSPGTEPQEKNGNVMPKMPSRKQRNTHA